MLALDIQLVEAVLGEADTERSGDVGWLVHQYRVDELDQRVKELSWRAGKLRLELGALDNAKVREGP